MIELHCFITRILASYVIILVHCNCVLGFQSIGFSAQGPQINLTNLCTWHYYVLNCKNKNKKHIWKDPFNLRHDENSGGGGMAISCISVFSIRSGHFVQHRIRRLFYLAYLSINTGTMTCIEDMKEIIFK